MRIEGPRAVAAGAQWRATLTVAPAARARPQVRARLGAATVTVRVRRVAAGRFALSAVFPRAGRWGLVASVGAARHSLGVVRVSTRAIRLRSVLGLSLHPDGGLLIADGDLHSVVRADLSTGRLTTFAAGALDAPTDVEAAADGTVYVADRHAGAVFRIANGTISRLFDYADPLSVAVDTRGNVFSTGRQNTVVRRDAVTGAVTRYAGTGEEGSTGDGGPALAAKLFAPHGVAVDPNDDVVVAEVVSVRRIDRRTNVIEAIAGNGQRALCGERGPATQVCLTSLRVAFEPDGDFWIADPENRRLWHVVSGRATAVDLGFAPFDVVVESERSLLVADSPGRRVLRYDVATGAATQVVPR